MISTRESFSVSSEDRLRVEVLLDGIAVENYRSFDKFPSTFSEDSLRGYLELGRLTTIIGRNDVGKSNLLHAVMLVLGGEKAGFTDFHKGNTSNDIVVNARFLITGDPIDVEKLKSKLREHKIYVDESNHFHLQLRVSYNPRTRRTSESWYTYNVSRTLEGISVRKYGVRRDVINRIIGSILPKPLYISSFVVPSNEVSLKKGSRLSELITPLIEQSTLRTSDGREINLHDFLKDRVERGVEIISKKLAEYLRNVWGDVEDVKITVSRVKLSQALELDVKLIDKHVGEISLLMRGSGLQREFIVELLRVYRDLKIGKGYILLIEEPEIFLHAGAQRKFMSILRDLSRNGQVIITTHSSIFIDRSDPRYIYLLKKESGHTVPAWMSSHDVRLDEIVEELGISPSDILLANGIIIVEGIIDVEVISIFANKVIPNWDELNVAVINGGGTGNIKHYINFPEHLKMLNNNIAIILDADITPAEPDKLPPEKEDFKKKMEKHGILVYFWKKNGSYVREIENLFDADSINKLLERNIRGANKKCDNYTIKPEEITPYTDVFELYKNKLRECGLEKIAENMEKRKFCKKVAKIMAENGKIPEDFENLLKEILVKFNLL